MNAKDSKMTSVQVLITIGTILVCYVLSYGPMSYLFYESSSDLFVLFFEVIYYLMEFLYFETPLDVGLDPYLEIWDF